MQSRDFILRAVLASATLLSPLVAARADDTQALKDRLHLAEKDTSLTADDVQPFYLKMSVQLFDAKGAPSENGTVEVFWAGDHKKKIVYTLPSLSMTEVRPGKETFRTANATAAPELMDFLLRQVFHPMPDASEIDQFGPLMNQVKFGAVLDCIMLVGPLGGQAEVPVGLFPTYCLTENSSMLRVAIHDGNQIVLRNSITTFQGRHVAHDIVVQSGKLQVAEAKIVSIEQRPLTDAELSTEGLPSDGQRPPLDTLVRVSGGVIQGMAINRPSPVYPAMAKARHAQGSVVLRARIGKDGRVHDLEVISSPVSDLAMTAVQAVRQWTYRPYLLAGAPVDVDTTINVNFALGN